MIGEVDSLLQHIPDILNKVKASLVAISENDVFQFELNESWYCQLGICLHHQGIRNPLMEKRQ